MEWQGSCWELLEGLVGWDGEVRDEGRWVGGYFDILLNGWANG